MSIQLVALLANLALACLKFTVGTLANSRALIADAFNSGGDVVATFVAWLAFRYGRKPPDKDHPYGHQNAEALAGLLLGGVLLATGCFICIEGILGLLEEGEPAVPGVLAIWAALITAAVKAVLWAVSIRAGRRTNSPTLLASARDHGADVVSGLVALGGIWVARHGAPQFDAWAGIVIGVYIVYLSVEPVRNNTAILMHAAPPELTARIEQQAATVPEVRDVRQVRVQPLGGTYRVDMSIAVDDHARVDQAHRIAHRVEDHILAEHEHVTEVHVHIEPVRAAAR